MTKLKFRKLNEKAILPTRGSKDACGLDIYSIEDFLLKSGERRAVKTGLAVEIPYGYYGRIAPRSGLALNIGIDVMAGVIDSDYRGELNCLIINLGDHDHKINYADRIAQLIIEKIAILDPIWDELNETQRNEAGFGSTGN